MNSSITQLPVGVDVDVPREVMDHSPTPIMITREDGVVLYRNAAMVKLAGLMDQQQAIEPGKNLHQWHHKAYAEERLALLHRLAIGEEDAVVRTIVGGEQMIANLRLLPRYPGEKLRTFLVMYEHYQGPAHAEAFPQARFYDAKHQYLGPLAALSQREIEVLALVGEGLTAAQIAARIHRSEETVNSHKASLLRKLGCQNAAQLAIIAYRAGLKLDDGARFAN